MPPRRVPADLPPKALAGAWTSLSASQNVVSLEKDHQKEYPHIGGGMDEKSLFTRFWTDESKTTLRVLARIPEGSDYRPDPKSRTAKEIAWQIVCEEKMIIEALESGKAEWAPAPMPATMKEVLEVYEQKSGAMPQRAGRLYPPRAGKARSTSSATSGPLRPWRGVFFSTSFTIAGRLPPTCGRWDRLCPRSMDRALTSHSG